MSIVICLSGIVLNVEAVREAVRHGDAGGIGLFKEEVHGNILVTALLKDTTDPVIVVVGFAVVSRPVAQHVTLMGETGLCVSRLTGELVTNVTPLVGCLVVLRKGNQWIRTEDTGERVNNRKGTDMIGTDR